MTEENIIKLTNALYKVTDLFPREEPLKFAIRKEGLDVLFFSNVIKGKSISVAPKEREQYLEKVMGKIELIKTYFGIAREQEWVNEKNFMILESEYDSLKDSLSLEVLRNKEKKSPVLERVPEVRKEEPISVSAGPVTEEKVAKKPEAEKREVRHINYEELSSVQLKVLEILQGQGQMKANQISDFFPQMNPRTIRRELKGLKEKRIITAVGGGKTTMYGIDKAF